jgi:hypothetical protein
MVYINPIEILKLNDEEVNSIDSNVIRKAKRKLFAEIDLSDDGLYDYYEQKITKSDCERAIDELENSNKFEFYYHLATNHVLNSFLANGNTEFLVKPKQESIYKLPEFINFISPYLSKKIDSLLLKAFQNKNLELFSSIIRINYLIAKEDFTNPYKSLSNEIEQRIIETDKLTADIKEGESAFSDENIESIFNIVADKFPIEFLNKLPLYFQSQINKIATSINYLQLNIWNEFDSTTVSLNLLEHLLSLNIESVTKPTFEKNFEIVKKAYEKRKEEEKLQQHIEKLSVLLNLFESKAKTIANARELIYQTKPYLFNLKAIFNKNDNTYISQSTRVASIAQAFIIEDVNYTQSSNNKIDNILGFPALKNLLRNAWEVTQLIGSLEMQNDFIVNLYNPNKESLKGICDKFSVATPQLVLGKLPQCNFVIIDGTITHIDKDSNLLPIKNPFIRGEVRYIGVNLKIEAINNQTVVFNLKYIQPNGITKTGTTALEGFTFAIEKSIRSYSEIISLSGWGNNEKGTFEVGAHYIEVWIDNCMIYRKSFVVDWSPEEKIENAKREAEKRTLEKIEAEKGKEQARIDAQKAKEKKIRIICLWIMGIFIGLALIFSIWGSEGLETTGIIAGVIVILMGIGSIRLLFDKL